MDFAHPQELFYVLLIEAFVLMSVALGFLLWRLRRLRRRLALAEGATDGPHPVAQWLEAEIQRTRTRLEQAGTNNPEAERLNAACEFRLRVLAGEQTVLQAADDPCYWQQISDYYETINKSFLAKLGEIGNRLRIAQERIANLERFKEQVFKLNERLTRAYATIQQLEAELEKALPAESRSAELAEVLHQLEDEKRQLEAQLHQVESEYETLMKNAEVLQRKQAGDGSAAGEDAEETDLSQRLANLEEENGFLCNQIATLLKQELYYENDLQRQRDALETQLAKKDETITALEAQLAELEAKYLALSQNKG